MIWLAIAILASVSLAPLAWSLRRASVARDRREAAMALHRAQLAELDRDFAEGRITPAEHENAKLEVQRRLLTAANDSEPGLYTGPASAVMIALLLVSMGSLGLYLIGGSPDLPAAPLTERIAAAKEREAHDAALIAELRHRLGELDPHTEQARQGYVLLGNAEASRGRLSEAADAWRTALTVQFDPTLAAEAGEAITEVNGKVTDEAAALFRRALAEAPAEAPWRPMAEKRLSEVK
jgi:cytochrome c-type biogenesis protein CcmH